MSNPEKIDINMLRKIRAIVLDMDGVLVDTEPIHMKSFAIYLDGLKLSYDEAFLQSLIGFSIEDNIRMIHEKHYQRDDRNIADDVVERDRIYIDLLHKSDLKPIDGIQNLIEVCVEKKITLALASSSDLEQVDIIIDGLMDLKLRNRLSSIVSGSDAERKKPDPEIYLKSLEKLGLEGRQCLAIEDSDAGVSSAKAAGLYCLAVKNPYTDVHLHPKADGVLTDIDDIVRIIKRL